MAPLPQEENESESMIEDKISDFLHCEVRATGKIYPLQCDIHQSFSAGCYREFKYFAKKVKVKRK